MSPSNGYVQTRNGAVFHLGRWLVRLPYVRSFALSGRVVLSPRLVDALATEAVHILERKKLGASSVNETDTAIGRQFRRASLQVHPDQNPDDVEKKNLFDQLKDAYEALRDFESRSNYLVEMLRLTVMGAPQAWLEKAHDAWHAQSQSSAASDTNRPRYNSASRRGATSKDSSAGTAGSAGSQNARIEGANLDRPPGILHIDSVDEWTRTVQVTLQFHSLATFEDACTSLVVEARPNGDQAVVKALRTCSGSELQDALHRARVTSGQVRLEVTLPDYGSWDLVWKACYRSMFLAKTTPCSGPRHIELVHPCVQEARKKKPMQIEMARHHAGIVKQILRQLTSNQQETDRDKLDAFQARMHSALAKGRSISHHLRTTLEMLKLQPNQCQEWTALVCTLDEAGLLKSTLDERLATAQKKDSLKRFKHTIAGLLERGEAARWVVNVSEDDLVAQGGEPNRLFQLLVDGKKANNPLLVDSLTLRNAAERTDLFSEKQCATMAERSVCVEAQMLEEAERLLKEGKAKQASLTQQPAVQKVRLMGLTTKPELNNTEGVLVGPSPENSSSEPRYVIQLVESGMKVAVKRENFEKLKPEHGASANDTPDKEVKTAEAGSIDAQEDKATSENDGFNIVLRRRKKTDKDPILEQSKLPRRGGGGKVNEATPAGKASGIAPPGSSASAPKAAERSRKASVTVLIHNKHVPQLIGAGGENVQRIKRETGVRTISALQESLTDDGWCPLLVEGPRDGVHSAVAAVASLFQLRSVESGKPLRDESSAAVEGDTGESSVLIEVESVAKVESQISASRRPESNESMACSKATDARDAPKSKSSLSEKCRKPVVTVLIQNQHVPNLIGPLGKNVQSIVRETRVKQIHAQQDLVTNDGWCPLQIEGSPERVQRAVEEINSAFPLCLKNDDVQSGSPSSAGTAAQKSTGPDSNTGPTAYAAGEKPSQTKKLWKTAFCPSKATASIIIYIHESDVPELVGPGGKHVKQLKKETGMTTVAAQKDRVAEGGWCPVLVEGEMSLVPGAVRELKDMFDVRERPGGPPPKQRKGTSHPGEHHKNDAAPTRPKGYEVQSKTRSSAQLPPNSCKDEDKSPPTRAADKEPSFSRCVRVPAEMPDESETRSESILFHFMGARELVGRYGEKSKRWKKELGLTNLFVQHFRVRPDGWCPVLIEGRTEFVAAALKRFVAQFNVRDLSGNPLAEEASRSDNQKPASCESNQVTSARSVTSLEPLLSLRFTASGDDPYEQICDESILIHDRDVAPLIGPKNSNLGRIKKATGVDEIYAQQNRRRAGGWCPLRLSGKRERVAQAVRVIQTRFELRLDGSDPEIVSDAQREAAAPSRSDLRPNGTQQSAAANNVVGPESCETRGACKTTKDEPRLVAAASGTSRRQFPTKGTMASMSSQTAITSREHDDAVMESSTSMPFQTPQGPRSDDGTSSRVTESGSGGCSGDPMVGTQVAVTSKQEKQPTGGRLSTAEPGPSTGPSSDLQATAAVAATEVMPQKSFDVDANGGSQSSMEGSLRQRQERDARAQKTGFARSTSLESGTGTTNSDQNSSPGTTQSTSANLSTASSHAASGQMPVVLMSLREFIWQHKDSLKCPPERFYDWLCSEDVSDLDALQEAVNDEGFLPQMQSHGLKGFKKVTFKIAVSEAIELNWWIMDAQRENLANAQPDNKPRAEAETDTGLVDSVAKAVGVSSSPPQVLNVPAELLCPISLVLMINDPVVASDGYTYERQTIKRWFDLQPDSEQITSPMTNARLPDLDLTPNTAIRNMARAYAAKAM